jgi:ATP-binding protein involved in chromosome partitioning
MNAKPRQIFKGKKEFRVVWQDGHESSYSYQGLRQACPCAVCRDELTGKRLLDPATIPADMAASKAELVGNYAVTFLFADGHAHGIYSFENLRQLCACDACHTLRPS